MAPVKPCSDESKKEEKKEDRDEQGGRGTCQGNEKEEEGCAGGETTKKMGEGEREEGTKCALA